MFMNKLKQIIESTDTLSGKIFDIFIQFLIIFSLICFSIETLPNLSSTIRDLLNTFEITVIIIFSLEYILRIIIADNKFRFIFSFYGIIDLAAILPFYIARTIDLRALRVFRLFRLLRVFKIVRYSKAMQRLKDAFILIKEELALFLVTTFFLLFVSAVGIYYFEHAAQPDKFTSVFHCLWWSASTLTTVGYGDIYPITTGGKIFTFVIVMIGIGIVAVPTGLIASALTRVIKED